MLLLAEQADHRDRLDERAVQFLARVDLDNMTADHPHGLVIRKALLAGMMTRLTMPSVKGSRTS